MKHEMISFRIINFVRKEKSKIGRYVVDEIGINGEEIIAFVN